MSFLADLIAYCHINAKIEMRGFQISEKTVIGGSVDAICTCDCHGKYEVKCLYKLRNQCNPVWRELPYITGDNTLQTSHSFYYQVMSYMGIY